jgi:hypothetical protein
MPTTYTIKTLCDFDTSKVSARIQGMQGTAGTNTTTNIDWSFPEECWLVGGQLLVNSALWGSYLQMQIVDKDNVLGGGAGAVVETVATNFYVQSDLQIQDTVSICTPILVSAGVYLRLRYTNTSLITAASISFNAKTYLPRD